MVEIFAGLANIIHILSLAVFETVLLAPATAFAWRLLDSLDIVCD